MLIAKIIDGNGDTMHQYALESTEQNEELCEGLRTWLRNLKGTSLDLEWEEHKVDVGDAHRLQQRVIKYVIELDPDGAGKYMRKNLR